MQDTRTWSKPKEATSAELKGKRDIRGGPKTSPTVLLPRPRVVLKLLFLSPWVPPKAGARVWPGYFQSWQLILTTRFSRRPDCIGATQNDFWYKVPLTGEVRWGWNPWAIPHQSISPAGREKVTIQNTGQPGGFHHEPWRYYVLIDIKTLDFVSIYPV